MLLLGKIIALAAMRQGLHTTWLPAYGAEVRGGSAYCMVVVSDEEIGSPYIGAADTLIAMNGVSLRKFSGRVRRGGSFIVNGSLIEPEGYAGLGKKGRAEVAVAPCTDAAISLGNIRVANMVALGVYLQRTHIIRPENVHRAMEESAPAGKRALVEINKAALQEGMRLER